MPRKPARAKPAQSFVVPEERPPRVVPRPEQREVDLILLGRSYRMSHAVAEATGRKLVTEARESRWGRVGA